MATAATTGPSTGTLRNVNDNQKRWMVFGLALKVLVDQIRSFVAQEIQTQYGNLKTSHGIDTQSTSGRLKNWPTVLKYENINGNDAVPKVKGKLNYSAFDCRVTSHVDFARLYLENHMAKFTAFDEHCDASAVLNLLGKVPVFSGAVQSAAVNVRQSRNAWAHCAFIDWNPVKFHQYFVEMEQLVKSLGLLPADENNLVTVLKEWESKGTLLCMNITMDPDLLKFVQQHVNALKADVDKLVFEVESDREAVKKVLQDVAADLNELEKRVSSIEKENEGFKCSIQSLQDEQSATEARLKSLKSDHENVQQRVTQVEEQMNNASPQTTIEIANCEADISFFAKRHDADTRQWLFEDFDNWFNNPGDSKAYVLLGDAGVGKSVIAGALAQRENNVGHLGAAYFCRHNDGTRNDPRYLLGTVAYQLCKCSIQYSNIVGGEGGVRMMLANSKLKVQELFTKLLEEPLSRCSPCQQRILVIIDALDETEYESREDFICLIQERFPRLPEWLVFFITSRPEDTIQSRLERYNPCVRICAGNSEQSSFYQQHVRDIQRFLRKRVDFSRFHFSLEDLTKECNGLFLYAFYIVKELNDPVHSGKFDQISNPFLGNIDDFFRKNFQRVFNKVGADLYQKLFGCMITAPSPLPVSFLSFVLNRENSDLNEQTIIDAVSQFVVLRTSDQTVTFLHNLIPTWLSNKRKARNLFIDKKTATEYLTKIFIETLTAVIDKAPPSLPSIDEDFHDFVLHAAVRFLCQNGDKCSLETVFSFLTSYRFLEKRIRSGRIEIYHLLEDLKLAAGCFTVEEAQKQNILQEISLALETDVHVLLECPHLLWSCIQNASNVVQKSILVPQVSVPWMECSICDISAVEILSECNCFATASDKKTVAAAKGLSLFFVDLSTLQKLNGPFQFSRDMTKKISHLEFSADDKFVFFGRLDKWFSVERGCVADIPQFIENSFNYEWVLLTSDGQSVVVEKECLLDFPQSCKMQFCITELLALWAMKEIDQSLDDQMTCTFSWSNGMIAKIKTTRKGQMARLLDFLKINPTLHQIHMKSLLNDPTCYYCGRLKELTESNQESSLATVRQLIIELYPHIFRHQVWNVHTGRPLLFDIFCLGAQFNSFTYFCHITSAFDKWGMPMECSGIDKALSVCNIAVVNAIYAFLKMLPKWNLEELRELKQIQEQALVLKGQKRRLDLAEIQEQQWELIEGLELKLEQILEQERRLDMELELEQIPEKEQKLKLEQIQEQERRLVMKLGLELIQIRKLKLKLKLTQDLKRRLVMELGLEQIQIHIQKLELEQIQEQKGRLDIKLGLEQMQIQIRELKLKLEQERTLDIELWLEKRQIQIQMQEAEAEAEAGGKKLMQEQKVEQIQKLKEQEQEQEQEQELKLKLEQIQKLKLKLEQKQEQERRLGMDPELEQIQEQEWELKLELKQTQEQERRLRMELEMEQELEQKFLQKWPQQLWKRGCNWDIQPRKWEHIQLKKWERKLDLHVGPELLCDSFKSGHFMNFPKGFLDLVGMGVPLWVSPGKKRVAALENIQKIHFLKTKIQEEEFCTDNSGKQEHSIARAVDFTFTTDDLYVVYLSAGDLLHALSLHALSVQTGTVFTSVSGPNLFYFTEEKQTGYLFRSGTDERAIFLTNLYSRLKVLRFPFRPKLGESVTAIFSSSNTVKFVTSDLMVTMWNTTNLKRGISFKFISSSCLAGSRLHVKKCVPSPDGKLIAIQQETKIELYSIAQSEKFHCTVFEADFGFTVVCLAFSADGAFLLFCVQDNFSEPHFYVWDVRKARSVSFKSPGLLAVECFCLSSDKRNLVLCGEYEIEVWEYDTLPGRLLKKSGVERFFNTVNFSQCTVSLDNKLLVCCIANVIFIYNLHVADFHSSKQVLRGHLGKIEFCKFLKVNRYLISYGVDGMVFLWDIIESKAAGFARVAQGQENICSMAVSPEEDRVICFLSSDRVSVINLCKLECSLSSELLTAPTKGSVNTAETSLQLAGRIASTSNIPTSSVEGYTAKAFRSPDLEERFLLTPDDLLDSDESDHSWSD